LGKALAGGRDAAGPAAARRPIWLYAPGRQPGDLPADIPGMTAVATWHEALALVSHEQAGRRDLEVAVYPCAPLQVLDPAGEPATTVAAT
jgi:hypothetical protein